MQKIKDKTTKWRNYPYPCGKITPSVVCQADLKMSYYVACILHHIHFLEPCLRAVFILIKLMRLGPCAPPTAD